MGLINFSQVSDAAGGICCDRLDLNLPAQRMETLSQSDSRDVEAQIQDDALTGNHRTKITIYSVS